MFRRVIPLIVALLLTQATHATQRAQGERAAASAALTDRLSAAITRGDVAGLVVMAASRDRILYEAAFGKADVRNARPMPLDAIFRIASMTKAVTSVAAMQLYEQGRIKLDDPAGKCLPELAHPIRHERRLGRTAGGNAFRQKPRGVFSRADLHAARHDGHLLQRA
jgi:CubicO group peptidase (beta-lactamase class C family)